MELSICTFSLCNHNLGSPLSEKLYKTSGNFFSQMDQLLNAKVIQFDLVVK